MNSFSNVKFVADTPVTGDEGIFSTFYTTFAGRELILNLVKQLNHIIKAVQEHRGISMGLLAGNKVFEHDFALLQKQLGRRIGLLEVFAGYEQELLTKKDLANLHMSWITIKDGWQGDRLMDNFELHSHFIEQLMGVVARLTKDLEGAMLNTSSSDTLSGRRGGPILIEDLGEFAGDFNQVCQRKIEVLQFLSSQLLEMIEFMAKIRGLASYAAALGVTDEPLKRKLHYLIACAREKNEKIRHCGQRLQEVTEGAYKTLSLVDELEIKFVFLIGTIEKEVLELSPARASASQLFDLASAFINSYWRIMDEGLYLVRLCYDDELEIFINGQ